MKMAQKQNKGVTLIELMISLALGLMLSAGAILIFVSNKETAIMQEQLARVQENGRFAVDYLARVIRMAGFSGCAGQETSVLNTLNGGSANGNEFFFGLAVNGVDNVNTFSDITGDATLQGVFASGGTLKAGTDVLRVERVDGGDCQITDEPPCDPIKGCPPGAGVSNCAFKAPSGGSPAATMKVSGACQINLDQILMVSDCTDTVIFQVTNCENPDNTTDVCNKMKKDEYEVNFNTGTGTPGNCTSNWGRSHEGSGIYEPLFEYYMILEDGNGVPSLWRWQNGTMDEMIENIDDMQLSYAVDTDGNSQVDAFQNAAVISAAAGYDWEDVKGVRLHILSRSPEANATNDTVQTISIDDNGDEVANKAIANDGRLRKIFSTTVTIRNKVQ